MGLLIIGILLVGAIAFLVPSIIGGLNFIEGIEQRNWKKVMIAILLFAMIIGISYLLAVYFITSM